MDGIDQAKARSGLRVLFWLFISGWTVLAILFLIASLRQAALYNKTLAIDHARGSINQQLAFKAWHSHQGVYVPISSDTRPGTPLYHLSTHDSVATNVPPLTLLNSCSILRQFQKKSPDEAFAGRLTSLSPLHPENAPDAWERSALEALQKGEPEVFEFISGNGDQRLRLMAPVRAEAGCRNCHPDSQEGSIAGGLSVTVSMARFFRPQTDEAHTNSLSFLVLWFIGCCFIWFLFRGLNNLLNALELATLEKLELVESLAQSRKLEALGALAGGIADDFNKLLVVILGKLEFLQMKGLMAEELTAIQRAAQKASGITQNLMSLSRRTPLEFQPVELNGLIRKLAEIQAPRMEADIAVTCRLAESIPPVLGNPGEIEQVILQLVGNARDAVTAAVARDPARSRRIIVETRLASLDESFKARNPDAQTGDYILMSISDTGTGMTPEIRQRVFEPFFTTKDRNKASGLGLATAWRIIRQHKGEISIYTEPGHGTTVRVFLPPVMVGASSSASEAPSGSRHLAGSEGILVVDDEPEIRKFASLALGLYGYTLQEAANGRAALEILEKDSSRIQLVITDVIMPELNGPGLIKEMRRRGFTHPVLLVSGYCRDLVGEEDLGLNVEYLQKPVAPSDLARAAREILDKNRA